MKGEAQQAHGTSHPACFTSLQSGLGGSGRVGRTLSQCSNWDKTTDIPDFSFSLFFFQIYLPGTHNLHYFRATREGKDKGR